MDNKKLASELVKLAKDLIALRFEFKALKADPESWYNKPAMLGHNWAKETATEMERIANKYGSKQTQQFIINKVFDFNNTDWHYFNHKSKKDLANALYVLKNLDAYGPLKTLYALRQRSGMWREDIEKILHVMAYDADPQKYMEEFGNEWAAFGMPKEEGEARSKRMVESFREKFGM